MTSTSDSIDSLDDFEEIQALPDALKSAVIAGRAAMRHRARSMSPEDRRAAIIEVTLPLLREYGMNVTTSQIARAAGIAEGTIFRVFPEKRDLVLAALGSAMHGDAEVAKIREISLRLPLRERLLAGLTAVADYQERFWSLIRVFRETGWQPERDETNRDGVAEHPMARIGAALRGLFEPDAALLRLEPSIAARMLLAMAFSNRMVDHGIGVPTVTTEQIVDLFLNGAYMKTDGRVVDD